MSNQATIFLILLFCISVGCATATSHLKLPSEQVINRGQLVIHTDFHLPEKHSLVDELLLQRNSMNRVLQISESKVPIHIYLFKNEDQYHQYMVAKNPLFPNRRAFFVKDKGELKVFAFWGSKVGEDVRHEVTHGYLHSVLTVVPIWLDEGIAEFFEVGLGKGGFNAPHAVHLNRLWKNRMWRPDLKKLETLRVAKEMGQTEYAESWLWIHFLITNGFESQQLLRNYLDQMDGVH
ncbi:MAG: hypothetical protein AAF623_07715, partial [Planctomycetota bacterium]